MKHRFLTEFFDDTTGQWEPLAITVRTSPEPWEAIPWHDVSMLPMPPRTEDWGIKGPAVRVVRHGQVVLEGIAGIFGAVGCWQDRVIYLDDGRLLCMHGLCDPETHAESYENWTDAEQRKRLTPEQYEKWRQFQGFIDRVLADGRGKLERIGAA